MKKFILFDFDGTLFDTAEGITRSVQYALSRLGIEAELNELLCFCGPPLGGMFAEKYGMTPEEAERAVDIYRERYSPIGWRECRPFEGMPELLRALKDRGARLAVATGKPHVFARRILEEFNMQDIFEQVCGSEFDGSRGQKHEVIEQALELFGASPGEAVMVGDRKYDVIGAKRVGVDCVGVRFGYAEPNELEDSGAIYIARDTDDLFEYLTRQEG